ncbi:camp-dependent protein kinase regulatory subunit [Calocera cornea HHB12733]|uniref:cAMP-dependent protein kinase regulatory subunit n=1 Tax=Calocera cornea HHB12733 TaxID=1353952 RepID=A0A165CTG7_9BASI|nr:camp-dependent protein kinase regulatory subunit [Calocera cornea HHB12733]
MQAEIAARRPFPPPSPSSLKSFGIPTPYGFEGARRGSVSAESITLKEGINRPDLPFYEKTPEQLARIKTAVLTHFLFKNLDPDEEALVVGAFKEVEAENGHVIIKQGDPGDFCYVIETGECHIYIVDFDEEKEDTLAAQGEPDIDDTIEKTRYGTCVTIAKPGDIVGELALMYNAPRAATVVAVEHCVLWALDRLTFRTILLETTTKKRRMHEQFLASVPIFKGLSQYERFRIADALEVVTVDKGKYVFKQGDMGDRFYIIESGKAAVEKTFTDENGNAETHTVALLGKGDFFGELALLKDQPRAASVLAAPNPRTRGSEALRLVSVSRDAFVRLMGPAENLIRDQQYSDAPIKLRDDFTVG